MSSIDIDISETEKEILALTVEAIGRTGAENFELGLDNDDLWYAVATYEDQPQVECSSQAGPVEAAVGLYVMLAAGGECVTCNRIIAIDHPDGLVDGARVNEGQFEVHMADPGEPWCVRRLDNEGWTQCGGG